MFLSATLTQIGPFNSAQSDKIMSEITILTISHCTIYIEINNCVTCWNTVQIIMPALGIRGLRQLLCEVAASTL